MHVSGITSGPRLCSAGWLLFLAVFYPRPAPIWHSSRSTCVPCERGEVISSPRLTHSNRRHTFGYCGTMADLSRDFYTRIAILIITNGLFVAGNSNLPFRSFERQNWRLHLQKYRDELKQRACTIRRRVILISKLKEKSLHRNQSRSSQQTNKTC